MKSTVVDENGDVTCPRCGAKNNFTSKRSGKAKIGLGLMTGPGALLAPKRLQCQGCGKYLKTAATRTAGPVRAAPSKAQLLPTVPDGTEVVLTSVGRKKVSVIKILMEHTELGLKDTKAFVDEVSSGHCVVGTFRDEDAENLRSALTEVGATVEVHRPQAEPKPDAMTTGTGTDDSGVTSLERLVALRESGALTDEEFAAAKQRVIDAM
jgi:large subunit ribosomal protein L7/L12